MLKLQCTICMENFAVAQELKILPCDHVFHQVSLALIQRDHSPSPMQECIDKWLSTQKDTCPIDGISLISYLESTPRTSAAGGMITSERE